MNWVVPTSADTDYVWIDPGDIIVPIKVENSHCGKPILVLDVHHWTNEINFLGLFPCGTIERWALECTDFKILKENKDVTE
jgi:hypothetical protein